jgi:hypothetical protein
MASARFPKPASSPILQSRESREPTAKDRFTIVFRSAAHAYHHVGQIIYLSKELTKPASRAAH